ncbi:GNAT family N-acetyltransferase [Leptothrix discophora]|uniref:GNAT family N-acetyltransferase n=1 Tax=Leptothrix discophora TaxID=89 RepID=A0ABT9G098_LEPDI|nr:GNAT family N-acetyltransferase [Leptothrix discophora]MDP4299908.1 GNAT family N-acetyltransferase [Leptothrix discophora]
MSFAPVTERQAAAAAPFNIAPPARIGAESAALGGLELSCRPLREVHGLESMWRGLESRVGASASAFLAWPWIGAWLGLLPPHVDVQLLQARQHAHVVGLALLVRTRRKLGPVSFCEAWHLHASGDPVIDKICIEHNDFLVLPEHGDALRAAMLAHWREVAGPAAELHLPGLVGDGWARLLPEGLEAEDETKRSAGVALDAVREAKLDFTPLLSSHSRRFVRRSIKEYQSVIGPLAVDEAASADQAVAFLDELVRLHEMTWKQRGLSGAFAGPGILEFHRRLIGLAWPERGVQLLRVRAGERPMGYLYAFVRGGRLYVYQSGFDYGLLDKHGRPGLVTHTLAIQHNAGLGHAHYDLLAGESQYKATVATVQETMTWSVWRKPALRFSLEKRLRNWVRQVKHHHRARQVVPASEPAKEED